MNKGGFIIFIPGTSKQECIKCWSRYIKASAARLFLSEREINIGPNHGPNPVNNQQLASYSHLCWDALPFSHAPERLINITIPSSWLRQGTVWNALWGALRNGGERDCVQNGRERVRTRANGKCIFDAVPIFDEDWSLLSYRNCVLKSV